MYKWLAGFIAVYSVFTLGVVYEAAGLNSISSLEVPYSVAISGGRTGAVLYATEGDMSCVQWLADNSNQERIAADFNGYLLLRSYFPLDYKFTLLGDNLTGQELVLCTSWNEGSGKYIRATNQGLRKAVGIDYGMLDMVYKSSDAVVYRIKEGAIGDDYKDITLR